MIREVILQAVGQVSETHVNGGTSRDPSSSGYTNGTPSMTLAQVWSDDDVDTYWYYWPGKNAGGYAIVLAAFAAPPTLVIFRSVKLQAWWTYSQQGPNNWYFPPTNDYGPRARLVVRNRAKTGNNNGAWHEITGAEVDAYNENINTGNGGYLGPLLQEWEMDAHPEGGPWTLDDMSVANFAAGIEVGAAAPAFTNEQGSFFKIRVHKFQVILTVEDLGGYVDNIRHAAAMTLRLMRRARNTVTLRCRPDQAAGELGSRVYLSHPHGPSVSADGWGRRRLERRPGMVLRRTIRPEAFLVEDQVFDLQAFTSLLWAAYRIDRAWSPELQGLALLEKGNGFEHSRNQDAWSPRPEDGVLMRVLEDYPDVSYHGLAAQGGGDVECCRRNYDTSQAGWVTVANEGTFSIAQDLTVSLVEEQGYLSSQSFTFGVGGGRGGRSQSLGALAAGRVHVRVIVRNTSVPDPQTQFAEWYFYGDGIGYWDEANRTWSGTPVYNPIPAEGPFGEAIADAIPIGAGTYTVAVGRFSSSISSVIFHVAVVNVQHTDATVAGCRTPIITLGDTITREADEHSMLQTTDAELWSYERGTAVVEVRPFWRAEALPHDAVKPLAVGEYANGTYDSIQFVAQTGTDDVIRFERKHPVYGTYQLDCPMPDLDLSRAHVLRAWARWLGAEGWGEYGPYSVEVGFAAFLESDGSLVASGSVAGALSFTNVIATRSWVRVGHDTLSRYADAYIRLLEVRRSPLSQLEAIWRV